jgi:23S rRNA (guanosine2251-2'-O)-methyltransferase
VAPAAPFETPERSDVAPAAGLESRAAGPRDAAHDNDFDEAAAEARFEGGVSDAAPGVPGPRDRMARRPMPDPAPRDGGWTDRRPYPGPDRRPYPGRGPVRSSAHWTPPRPTGLQDPSLALAEGEELVAGRRPVEEAFVARREAKRLLVVPQRRQALEKLVLHATSLRIPVVEVEGGTLTAISGFDGHQGIALVVEPRHWASPDEVLARAAERGEPPLVLVLDSLEDPQNVGTLLRTAEATGAHGAVFPTRHQAPLSPAAVKASAGAVEHLRLAPVDDLPGALADLHIRGLRIVGADGDAPLTAREADLRGPIAIVVGSEGRGLGPAVRRRCDLLVRIPMHGHVESLNAAVAGSILLYEAAAQRRVPEAPLRPMAADDDMDEEAPPPATDSSPAPTPGPAKPLDPVPGASAEAAATSGEAIEASPAAGTATPDAAGEAVAPEARRTHRKVADADPATVPDDTATLDPVPATAHGDASIAGVVVDPAPEPAAPGPRAPKARRARASKAGQVPAPDLVEDDLLPGGPAVDPPTGELADGRAGEAATAPEDPAGGSPEV